MIVPAAPIATVDYHTAGEPFRIVTGGVPVPDGATVLDRRDAAIAALDDVRALLINEPRGHADMYGCFMTPPDDPGAAFGMLFFHKDGFSTACGHGTIAGVTWALDSGLVPARAPTTELHVDVPSGRLAVQADVDAEGRVGEVRFTNVASWVAATDLRVTAAGQEWTVDVSFGGAFYASARASDAGAAVTPADLADLTRIGREIRRAVDPLPCVRHPTDDRLSGCYGTIWWEDVHAPSEQRGAHSVDTLTQRNVTIFADGEVDRSPCGSGTSARLAVLQHRGALVVGQQLHHVGIVGTAFDARVSSIIDGPGATGVAVVTEIGGHAYRTGSHEFVLDPRDPLGVGFQLR